VSLADIAAATKISPAALEALERNEVKRLPGGIFGRAIVRSYALTVGLDPEATVNEFLAEIARVDRERAQTTRGPEITSDDRQFLERQRRAVRMLRTVLIAAVIVAAAVASWFLWGRRWMPDRSAPPPTSTAAPPAAVVPPPPAPVSNPLPVKPTPPAGGSVASPTGPPPSDVVAPIVVEFEVTAACWVRITADGGTAVDGILQPGPRQRVAAVKSLRVSLGNAGAFQWWINGKPAKLLGPAGTTRQIAVTPENIATFLQ